MAEELAPFALAARDETAASCFRLQARDDARHARFFDRVAAEVARAPGAGPGERREALRPLVDRAFLSLFEERLPRVARELAAEADGLGGAIALYHLVLEGVVFTAGQFAMLTLLEEDEALPGLRQGVELVLRDERWHIGFGARSLALIDTSPETAAGLLAAAKPALDAWGDVVEPPAPNAHARAPPAAPPRGRRARRGGRGVKIAVCVKQVPRLDDVRFDSRNRIVREEVELMVNPLDLQALRRAFELRDADGGEVVVLTMGPPAAREILEEAVRRGADRAVHLVDKRFGGADTLATARALAHALER